jgi:hypothetical protein
MAAGASFGRILLLLFFFISYATSQIISSMFISFPLSFSYFFFYLVLANSALYGNCNPFGGGNVGWGKYLFFQYSNIPNFTVTSGNILAFDFALPNDYLPAFASIALATPTEDTIGNYTAIIINSAASSLGDTIIGNFEVRFTITQQYSFPGGTLIMRFENGGSAANETGFSSDSSCTQVLIYGSSEDTSG